MKKGCFGNLGANFINDLRFKIFFVGVFNQLTKLAF